MKKLTSFHEIGRYVNVPAEAVEFVMSITKETPNGKYPFGEFCFVNVMDAPIKPRTELRAEAHNLYIDVQCLIEGDERIYYTNRESLSPVTEYNAEKDVIFYAYETADVVDFTTGECVILDTVEAHHPGISVNGTPSVAKKAVMKVRK
ncbi:MAG: YhcH/YjgK/YiaL family protein [Clostridia bacterium]|nr:YhcH/YjgK/YiaL family protein [Clostridia bacterium]